MAKPRAAHPLFVESVEKAFAVLKGVASGPAGMSISDVAAAAGLDRSAAQRYVHTLLELGYLARDENGRNLAISARALRLAGAHLQRSELVMRGQPFLAQLARETGEAVNLTLLDGPDIVFVARYPSRHMLAGDIVVGSRMPAYCSSAGRAILSAMPDGEIAAAVGAYRLVAHTEATITDPAALTAAILRARTKRYAICFGEYYAHDLSFAAPIIGGAGRVLGAINISVSRLRHSEGAAERRFAPLVVAAADTASGAGGA